jgi:glyoxylase-like metal-dependent hydrolase (beta-lactamase superfamily II)
MRADDTGGHLGCAPMRELAPGVFKLRGFPPNAINVYLVGDVLIDAATRLAGRRILRQIKGRRVTAHALTHSHPDHQGASHSICEQLDIPYWVGERDVQSAESGKFEQSKHPLNRIIARAWGGPGHPVSRRLREGDEVAGFQVLDVPGHSPGHLAYWRESDGVLIVGDVMNGMNLLTSIPGLREPPDAFTPDVPRNRESIRRLAELRPALMCFGHGPPLRNAADKLARFAGQLPE